MKLLIYILPIFTYAQLSLSAGIVDLQNTLEGQQMNFTVGYTEWIHNGIGVGANYRWTHTEFENFKSFDFLGKFGIEQKGYRVDFSGGVNYHQKDWRFRPMVGIRNSFSIDELVWISIDLDHVLNIGTYGMLGINLDTNLFKELFEPFKSSARFY